MTCLIFKRELGALDNEKALGLLYGYSNAV